MASSTEAIRVLHVEDDSDVADTAATVLEDEDWGFEVETATTASQALSILDGSRTDCVVSAQHLPHTNGLELFDTVQEHVSGLPFVIFASDGSERLVERALTAGVTDYITISSNASQYELLANRVRNAILAHRAGDTTHGSGHPHQTGPRSSQSQATATDSRSKQRRQEQAYRTLVEKSNDIVVILDADGRYQYVSPTIQDVLGYDPDALLGDEAWEYVHPDDRDVVVELFEEAVTSGVSADSKKYRFRHANGSWRWLRSYSNNQLDNPDIEGYVVNSRDVTAQHIRKRQLKREKRTVESIFSAIPDVLYTFDTEGYLLRWNDELERETGYSADELEEMYVTDFVPEDEKETIERGFREIIQDRRSITIESAFETKAGDRVPFEFTGAPLEDTDGGLRGVTGVGRNISDRKKRQRRFEAVFNNTYQFTGLMAPDGTLLEVNRTAAEFADSSPEALTGDKIWESYWFQASETARQVARRSVETASAGDLFQDQVTVQGSDREIVIDFSVRPVTDESGAVDLLIPEGRDITRISEQKQQFEVTNRFLRHNIRNTLNTVIGHGDIVQRADDPELRSSGERIVEAARSVTETADVARQIHNLIGSDPTPAPTALEGTLSEAVAAARANHPDAEITLETEPTTEVMGIPSLDRAFTHLLDVVLETNAEDATAHVRVEQSDTATVVVASPHDGLFSAERKVLTGEIEVGPLEHAQRLDVWYVYWHVRFCGGDIEVEDDGDVRVTLPLADAE